MAMDRWAVQAVAQEEAAKAIKELNINNLIESLAEEKINVKIKTEIDNQFNDLKEVVKVLNDQIIILKKAMELMNERIK